MRLEVICSTKIFEWSDCQYEKGNRKETKGNKKVKGTCVLV